MKTSPDADRYADVKLALACLECGSVGLIPIENLDHILCCRRCEALFRVEAAGLVEIDVPQAERIRVQVRSNSSGWRDEHAVIQREPSLGERLHEAALEIAAHRGARLAALAAVVVTIVLSVALATRQPEPPPKRELPTELNERAIALTEAVARRDMELLIALTDPAEHRALRIWLAHAEGVPKPVTADAGGVEVKVISTSKMSATGDKVAVRVAVRTPTAKQPQTIDELWVKHNEVWHFKPVRLRMQARPIAFPAKRAKS